MDIKNIIKKSEMGNLDPEMLPNGVNYILDDNMQPVGVIMNIKYYTYLEQLMFKLRDKIKKLEKSWLK